VKSSESKKPEERNQRNGKLNGRAKKKKKNAPQTSEPALRFKAQGKEPERQIKRKDDRGKARPPN